VYSIDQEILMWLIEKAGLSETADKFLYEERHLKKDVILNLNIKSVTDSKKVKDSLISIFGEERCMKSGIVRRGDYGSFFYFYTPCLLFPYYEQDGTLVGIQSRYLGEKNDVPRFQFLAAQKTRLFNLPILNTLKMGDKLYISEGITDCLAMLSSGLKAVAIPSATIQPVEDLILLKNYDLHMYPDQDDAGQRAYMELRRFFVNNYSMVKAEKLPEGVKDYCDYYISQVSDGK
jgi:DNA primase